MSIFKKLKSSTLNIQQMVNDAFPEQYGYTKFPENGTTFIAKTRVVEAVIIPKQYKDTTFKELFILDEVILKHLDKKDYRPSRIDVLKSENGVLHAAVMTMNSKSPWIISKQEVLEKAETTPVFTVRDKEAQLYVAHEAGDVEIEPITDEEIEQLFEDVFGKHNIDSLDHPALVGLVKSEGEVDVVDESTESEISTNTDDANSSGLKNELELEDLMIEDDSLDELDLDDDTELEFSSLDDIDLDDLAA